MKTVRTAALIGMILGGALVIQLPPAYALPMVGCCQYTGPSSCVGGVLHNNCPGTGGTFLPQYLCIEDNCVPALAKPDRKYTAWFARAMDECTSPTVTVLGSNNPSAGCIQANSVTEDSTIQFNNARLGITAVPAATGRLKLVGRGFQAGVHIKVQLTVRVTKPDQDILNPALTDVPVTFPDVTVQCPNTVSGFVASQFGAVAGLMNLSDCLPPGLSTGNIEILDAALVNADDGKVFARPGIETHVVSGNP